MRPSLDVDLDPEQTAWAIATLATVLLAGALDRVVGPPSDRHAVLVAALAFLASAGAWALTRRLDVAWIAAATLGASGLLVATHRHLLATALLPAAVMLLPPGWLDQVTAWITALTAGLLAGAVSWYLTGTPFPTAIAAVATTAVVVLRPELPTEGTIGTIRSTALLLPGLLLIGLVPLNAATGWFDAAQPAEAVFSGLALVGVLGLIATAGLGLSTLLESAEPRQQPTWLAVALGIGVLLAALPTKDLVLLRAAVAFAIAPIAVLAALLTARLMAQGRRWRVAAPAIPIALATLQFGLI